MPRKKAEKAAKDAENNKSVEDPVEQVQAETAPSGESSTTNTGGEATQPPPAEEPPKTTEQTVKEIEPTPPVETPDTPFVSSLGVDEAEALAYWEEQEEALYLANINFIIPTKFIYLANVYGDRVAVICDNKKKSTSFHEGWDLSNTLNTPIVASANGTVVKVVNEKNGGRSGNYIVIDHGNGYQTAYLHLNQFADIKPGDFVGQGWVIGYMGKTGSAKGVHLHFMVKDLRTGEYVNPYNILTLPRNGFSVAKDVYYDSKTKRYYNYKEYNKKTKIS